MKLKQEIFQEKEGDLVVKIRIVPNSSRNQIVFEESLLKIKITAQPVENKANKMLIEFLSKKIRTAKSNIEILKGELNKDKVLLIKNFTQEQFLNFISV